MQMQKKLQVLGPNWLVRSYRVAGDSRSTDYHNRHTAPTKDDYKTVKAKYGNSH